MAAAVAAGWATAASDGAHAYPYGTAAGASSCAANLCERRFGPGAASFVVPRGVDLVGVALVGGHGGGNGGSELGPGSGGPGGMVVEPVVTKPGQTLRIQVGRNGHPGEPDGADVEGGWPDGGAGDTGGAGGGGSTSVTGFGPKGNSCWAAGGGGGAGGSDSNDTKGGEGGGLGGALTSGDGPNESGHFTSGKGGGAGDEGGFPAGGTGGTGGSRGIGNTFAGRDGDKGVDAVDCVSSGGAGGQGGESAGGGGGGGGGYGGGGGGGGGGFGDDGFGGGGGGGAGGDVGRVDVFRIPGVGIVGNHSGKGRLPTPEGLGISNLDHGALVLVWAESSTLPATPTKAGVAVPLNCVSSSCQFTLTLTAGGSRRTASADGAVVGHATLSVEGGRRKTGKVALNATGRRRVRASGSLRVTLVVLERVHGGKPSAIGTKRLTIRR